MALRDVANCSTCLKPTEDVIGCTRVRPATYCRLLRTTLACMPLPTDIRDALDRYARNDLDGDLEAHVAFFDFLNDDADLRRRVGEEYLTARYLYKLFEGMRLGDEWARRAQIQLQVQQYASIYGACIHHLLFVRAAGEDATKGLLRIETLKRWSVSGDLRARLAAISEPGGREVVAAIRSDMKLDETKVRFDSKARAAAAIGVIDDALANELVYFYRARNMIHIHAELKKGADWSWEIDFAKQAYWRLNKFAGQARAWLSSVGETDR